MSLEVVFGGDRERQFADWGVGVVWREVSAAFDPEAQVVSESYNDTAVTAVVGAAAVKSVGGTGGQDLAEERQFLVRAADLPAAGPSATCRVVLGSVEYDVLEFGVSADGLVYAVRGRRRG